VRGEEKPDALSASPLTLNPSLALNIPLPSLERLNRQRFQPYRLVIQPVPFAEIQRMLQPVIIVTQRVIVACMGTAAFLAGSGRNHRRQRHSHQVFQFQRFDSSGVVDLAVIAAAPHPAGAQQFPAFPLPLPGVHLPCGIRHNAFAWSCACVRAARPTGNAVAACYPSGSDGAIADPVRHSARAGERIFFQVLDTWLPAARPNTIRSSSELLPRRLAPCHRNAGAFADGVKSDHGLLRCGTGRHHHLALQIGGNTAHHVNGLLAPRESAPRPDRHGRTDGKITDARQAMLDHLRTEMVKFQFDIIARPCRQPRPSWISTAIARDTTSSRSQDPWRWARSAP